MAEYQELVGKRVSLVMQNFDKAGNITDQTTMTGRLESSNTHGILFIPKGKAGGLPVLNHEIVSLESAETPVKFVAKKMPFIALEKLRQHLADRHGFWLGKLRTLTDEDAQAVHTEHHRSELGHFHEE